MYVYEEPKVTFEIPYRGTPVLAVPPIAVTVMKLVGGFKYQAEDAVEGRIINENTYVC